MRALVEVVRFEISYQLRSPFFASVCALFFIVHLLAITSTGINIGSNEQILANSGYQIILTTLGLGVFGVVAIIVFVVTGITRDHELSTLAMFLTTPIRKHEYFLGRFTGSLLPTLLVGVAGLLGMAAGTYAPWMDQTKLGEFEATPYIYSLLVVVLPNLFVACGLAFCVAALTQSVAATFGVAIAFVLIDIVALNLYLGSGGPLWAVMADPFGLLAMTRETSYWTVTELNTRLPVGMLPLNRLLWASITLAALVLTLVRYRFEPAQGNGSSDAPRARTRQPLSVDSHIGRGPDFGLRSVIAQFRFQARADTFAVITSPLFGVVVVLTLLATIAEFYSTSANVLNLPLVPVTSRLLDAFRVMTPYFLIIVIYFTGALIHRERDSTIGEMVDTTPRSDWIMVTSKLVSLCGVVTLLLIAMIITSVTLQAISGYTRFELPLYLESVFIYTAPHYFMLCTLAVTIHALTTSRWIGLTLVGSCCLLLFSLPALGLEHLLYRFAIPPVVYSDMNGFGHFSSRVHSLTIYWFAGCLLMLVLAHLFYPRGYYFSFSERLRDARARFSPHVMRASIAAAILFVTSGAWIFYNTNILNAYITEDDRLRTRADYERAYADYDIALMPSFRKIDMQVDLFPESRSLESRGRAVLSNNKDQAIDDLVISVDPAAIVHELVVPGADLVETDAAQGFYRFHLASVLAPGEETTMTWRLDRTNRGFVNSGFDNELVENGTFIDSPDLMPMPGFDDRRRITDATDRRRAGLPPAPRTPALGDPAYLDRLRLAVDSRSDFTITLSTSEDQTAVTFGSLVRAWSEHGRRYFRYESDRPIWPVAAITSARFEIARARWHDVDLEVYYHPSHAYNVDIMLSTAKRALDYFTHEFAPYPYGQFRIIEYPRYRNAARAFPGTVPYSETVGFITDLSGFGDVDYATIHELAHMWWGDRIAGARMQGRQMLNETMAQYATLKVLEEYYGDSMVNRSLAMLQYGYLNGRKRDSGGENPLMYTEEQGYVSYNKGPLVLYALQDLVGTEPVHRALRRFLDQYGFKPPPFPTSRDLVNALRDEVGVEHQALITDLFERIVLYDLDIRRVYARRVDGEYEVVIQFSARKLEADGFGIETERPLSAWFDVVVFAGDEDTGFAEPLHAQKHLIESGAQELTIRVAELPARVGLDPWHKMIDRSPANNVAKVEHLTPE